MKLLIDINLFLVPDDTTVNNVSHAMQHSAYASGLVKITSIENIPKALADCTFTITALANSAMNLTRNPGAKHPMTIDQ